VAAQVEPLDGLSLVPLIEDRMQRREKPLGFWVYPEPGIGTPSQKLLEALAREQSAEVTGTRQPDPAPHVKRYPEDSLPGPSAWIDGDYKLHRKAPKGGGEASYSLFDLSKDEKEKTDISARDTERTARMRSELEAWQKSVLRSLNGGDYT
jgi:hypothetical protein